MTEGDIVVILIMITMVIVYLTESNEFRQKYIAFIKNLTLSAGRVFLENDRIDFLSTSEKCTFNKFSTDLFIKILGAKKSANIALERSHWCTYEKTSY